jgi:hypothetical protein
MSVVEKLRTLENILSKPEILEENRKKALQIVKELLDGELEREVIRREIAREITRQKYERRRLARESLPCR